jgi:hypothetical protein
MSNYLINVFENDTSNIYTAINFLDIGSQNLPIGYYEFNPHASLEQIVNLGIVDKKFVEQADIYACLRNPVDRFISRAYHIKNFDKHIEVQSLNKNELVEKCLTMYDAKFHMWWPQTTWCLLNKKPVNKLFLYENFDKAAFEMTGVNAPVHYRHRNDCRENDLTPLDNSLIQEIEKLYAEDVALYNSI